MKEFDWNKFKDNDEIGVHCKTEEEAKAFCKVMNDHGMRWNNGHSYLLDTYWNYHKQNTVYYGNGTYCDIDYTNHLDDTIFEFSDYFCENVLPTIVITSNGKTTTATVQKGHKVIKKASVSLYYKNKFDLYTGAEKALKKLFGKQKKVEEINRPAKIGEYIKLTKKFYSFNEVGDVLRVDNMYERVAQVLERNHPSGASDGESFWNYPIDTYVVLKNYKPKSSKKANKSNFKFKVGNWVNVIDTGKTYSTFDSFFENCDEHYSKNYIKGENPQMGTNYLVVGYKNHPTYKDDKVYTIQDTTTLQVFLIREDGLKLAA